MTFGERLKKARKSKGLTQKELAEIVGIAKTTLGNYEINFREPNLLIFGKLVEVLDADANELLGRKKSDTYYSKDESGLISLYREMNQEGQEKIIDYIDDLKTSQKYKKDTPTGALSKEA